MSVSITARAPCNKSDNERWRIIRRFDARSGILWEFRDNRLLIACRVVLYYDCRFRFKDHLEGFDLYTGIPVPEVRPYDRAADTRVLSKTASAVS